MTRGAVAAFLLASALPLSVSAQVKDWPSERPPRPLPARQVKFPPYSVKMLPNGLQVVAVSHHEQPAVSLRLLIRVGGAQDPADKPGVATMAASLLDQGTTAKNAEEIASAIDSIGGALGVGASSDLTFVNAIVMKDSLGFGLDLVSEVARHPAFAPEEVERQRQQILSSLKVSYDQPDYLAGTVFDRLVYGAHPYGRPDSGTPASIAGITRNDLLAFHKAWFGANNAILAIVGDVSAEEAFAGAERAFGSWERSTNTVSRPSDPPQPARRVVVIDRPGAVQTEIRVGNVGLPRKHPDYLALDLAVKILGGEGGNRLHRVLRAERGLTYGASADTNALKDAGDIVADTDTRSETTGEALRLIVDEFWRLQRDRVSDRELSDAQAYLTGNFPLTIETPSAIAMQVLNAVFYGLDLDELQTYRERVNAVTPDDIQRVARQYFHPDKLSIVLVGDASAFAKQLPGAGFPQFERISVDDLDLASMDLRHRAAPSGHVEQASYRVPVTSEPWQAAAVTRPSETAEQLIERAVKAKGGIDKLRSVKTLKAEATTTVVDDTKRTINLQTFTSIQYPGSFRVDVSTPAGTLTQVFSKGVYWVKDARGVREAPQPVADDFRANVQRDAIALLISLTDRKVNAARVADVQFGGRSMPALQVTGRGMAPLTVIVDPTTSLIVGQRYPTRGVPGSLTEEEFSDFRDVAGLKVPFSAVIRVSGQVAVRRTIRTVNYNVSLDPSIFARPS